MRRALLLGAVLLLPACQLAGNSQGFPHPRACSTDKDCNTGEVCLDIGCAMPDEGLVAEVVPQSGNFNGLVTQDFANVDVAHSIDLKLGRADTLHLSGNAYPFKVDLSGTALHIPDESFTLPSLTVTSSASISARTGFYVIRATPLDPLIPPIQLSTQLDATGSDRDLSLSFATKASIVQLAGALQASSLLGPDGGLAYDVQVLRDSDGWPVSQAVTTGPGENGLLPFALALAPVDPGEPLRLTASPHQGLGPTVSFHDTLTGLSSRAQADGGLPLGGLSPVVVEGMLLAPGDGGPVAGATVQLTATLPGDARYSSPPVTTDSQGVYRALALHDQQSHDASEDYSVVVTPPLRTGLAIASMPATAAWPQDGGMEANFAPVTVPALTLVTGRVLDSGGKPVPGAQVQATPTPDSDLPLQSASATTDATGQYRLAVSPGIYRFEYTPPIELLAPSGSRGPLPIGARMSDPLDLPFSAARVVSGTVQGPDGHPVESGQVRILRISYPYGQLPHSTLLARSQLLPGGSFTVVLPAPPTATK